VILIIIGFRVDKFIGCCFVGPFCASDASAGNQYKNYLLSVINVRIVAAKL